MILNSFPISINFEIDSTLDEKNYLVIPVTKSERTYFSALILSLAFQFSNKHDSVLINLADPKLRSRIRNGQTLQGDQVIIEALNPYKEQAKKIGSNIKEIEKDGINVKVYNFFDGKFKKQMCKEYPAGFSMCKYQVKLYERKDINGSHFDILLPISLFNLKPDAIELSAGSNQNCTINEKKFIQLENINSEKMEIENPKFEKLPKIITGKVKEQKLRREHQKSSKVTKPKTHKNKQNEKKCDMKENDFQVNIQPKVKGKNKNKVKMDEDKLLTKDEMIVTHNDPQNKSDLKTSNIISLDTRSIRERPFVGVPVFAGVPVFVGDVVEEADLCIDLNIPLVLG